jgi:hypothetical protein
LIDVVAGHDVRAAEQAMREHVRYGLEGILEMIGPKSKGDWRLRR